MRKIGILTAFVTSLLLVACSTQSGQGSNLNPYSSGESNVSPEAARNPDAGGGSVSSGNDSMNPM